MSVTTRDVLQFLAGDRPPIHRATPRNLGGVFPFQSEGGLIDPRTGRKVLGLPVGYAGRDRSGGIFFYDPVMLYQAGLVHNTNVKVLGEIGNRKSAGEKFEIYLGVLMGYNHLVTDRKGEYTALADAIPGSRILRFGQDTKLFINPLDNTMDYRTQQDLVSAMGLTSIGGGQTDLTIEEKSLLWHAIQDVHQGRDVAVLPQLVELLFEPSETIVQSMHRSLDVVKDQGYKLALGLQRVTEGDLRGMFHEPTTPGMFEEKSLQVLNCEKIKGEMAVIMITVINFFTQSQWGGQNPSARFHRVIHDESWDLAAYPGFVESVRRAFKLGGTWGVSNTIVAHHLSNLYRSGKGEAIRDLVADSDITKLYRQDRAELEASADELGLNETEVNRICQLPAGTAMYKIADLPGIEVKQNIWPELLPVVETRHLLKGQEVTDLPRAV